MLAITAISQYLLRQTALEEGQTPSLPDVPPLAPCSCRGRAWGGVRPRQRPRSSVSWYTHYQLSIFDQFIILQWNYIRNKDKNKKKKRKEKKTIFPFQNRQKNYMRIGNAKKIALNLYPVLRYLVRRSALLDPIINGEVHAQLRVLIRVCVEGGVVSHSVLPRPVKIVGHKVDLIAKKKKK